MFRTRNRRLAVVALAAAGAVLLAGCGGGDNDMGHDGMDMPASDQPAGDHNSADVEFATAMITHHQQALEMAALAEDRAQSPEVKALAAKIEKAQDPEIELMSGWLRDWDQPVPSPGSMSGHQMPGMMSEHDMASLKDTSGKDFDRLFLKLMISHHQGAVDMARDEQKDGKNPAVKKLARSIATSQTAEIKQMRDLLDRP